MPRPAMLVATVTAALSPAMAMIAASRSCCLAFSTSCLTPACFSSLDKISDLATLAVPISTGWPFSWRSATSSTIAANFASSVR